MKYYLYLLPLLFSISVFAQESSGIEFVEKPFEELLARAKSEDKLIFIDAYTTWCGPCKMMVAKVFPDEQVGAVYNERFINAKFDMEKGEGIGLAKRYSVMAYPTYLFVDGEGELVHKGLGYIPIPALLELADAAVSENSMGALEKQYRDGNRDPEFIKRYASMLASTQETARADRVIGEYLDKQDDWSTPANLELILSSPGDIGDKRMIYLVEHIREIEESLPAANPVSVLQRAFVNHYHRTNRKRNLVDPEEIEPFYREQAGELSDRLLANYSLTYHQRKGDMGAYLPLAVDYYTEYPSENYTELNSVAWTFFEGSDDPEQLALAIQWAEKSVALRPYYPNLDTLAWLYHKTGQQEKAEETARQAIEYAKAESLDYSDTEKIFQ